VFCCVIQTGFSQGVGTWKTYLAYHNTTVIAEGNNYVFAVADGSLYSYGKNDKSINYYNKQTGLSDNKITTIAFNSNENILVITYANGNIDLLGENEIKNMSYLKESTLPSKTVNTIYNYNEYAYLCADFGIVVLNLKRKEVKETYRFNKSVSSVVINGNDIYAVVDHTILKASLDDNLIDPGNWKEYYTNHTDIDKSNKVKCIALFQDRLSILVDGKGIYYQANEEYKTLLSNALDSMKVENDKLITFSKSDLYIYSSLTERDKGSLKDIKDVSSLKNKNTFWIAAGNEGIIGLEKTGSNQYETIADNLNLDGPKRNYNAFLKMYNDKLYIAGGGRWTNRNGQVGTIMIYDPTAQTWNNYDDISNFWDATSIAIDPTDESHLFVSTWGEGVYEFKEKQLDKIYNTNNSSLESALNQSGYIRVEGLCYDKNNNLWMTNTGVSVIKILKADGTWTSLYYPAISSPSLPDKILISDNGDKWVNLVRGNKAGLFVFNDNGTIEDISDDKSHYFSSLYEGTTNVEATEFFCISEDKNKDLWIGTNRGPVILYNPARVLDNPSNVTFTRIVQNGAFFLPDERVKAIAVDGGNRKWIGTSSSGVLLVSEDGKETLEHFTTENSYLLSNNIESIEIDHKTGEVFIGTENGLVSYFGEATLPSEDFSDVYAYPNPVRPNFDERVIITGLMENSNVKITDVNGNLVYQTKSVGGQVSWDCKNRSGKRVASGVYLVLAATPEAKESVVTKIAVIK